MPADVDTIKAAFALAAAATTIPTYAVYIRETRAGRTHPHPVSWALWAVESYTSAIVKAAAGAQWGALPAFLVGVACTWIAAAAYTSGVLRTATRADYVCAACTVTAWSVWLTTGNEAAASAALAAAYVFAFAPTVTKTWNLPYSEPPATYLFAASREAFTLAALGAYNVASAATSAVGGAAEAAFLVMILARRAMVPAPHDTARHPDAPLEEMTCRD